jgi:hypothetical protein
MEQTRDIMTGTENKHTTDRTDRTERTDGRQSNRFNRQETVRPGHKINRLGIDQTGQNEQMGDRATD